MELKPQTRSQSRLMRAHGKVHGVGTERHWAVSCGQEESAMAGLIPGWEGGMPGDPRTKSMRTRQLPDTCHGPTPCRGRYCREGSQGASKWQASGGRHLPELPSAEAGVLSLVPKSNVPNLHLPAGSCRAQILSKAGLASFGSERDHRDLFCTTTPEAPRRLWVDSGSLCHTSLYRLGH